MNPLRRYLELQDDVGRRRQEAAAQKKARRKAKLAALVIVLVLALAAMLAPVVGLVMLVGTLPKIEMKDLPPIQTSFIYAADGSLLARLHGEQNRTVVPIKDIPDDLKNAVISIEDNRFYEHGGVDVIGVARALVEDVKSRSAAQGASTISMQYVKEAFLTQDRTLVRKLQQVMLALELEEKHPKDKILEMYLNRVYFGSGAYGVQVASESYFGKPVQNLTLPEAALLAGIIQRPEGFNPFNNPKAALSRRNLVIDQMVLYKRLEPERAVAAKKEPLGVHKQRKKEFVRLPYFVDYVKREISKKYGPDAIFKSGMHIFTTIDPRMMKKADQAVFGTLNRPGDPSGSIVAINVKSGAIKAMVGGKNYKKQKFNFATQARRQPGSSFKPIVLATALDKKIKPTERFPAPGRISFKIKKNTQVWNVSNYSDSRAGGSMNLVSATIYSTNTVYAGLVMRVGVKNVVKMARELGIRSDLANDPAIALGGTEFCCTPMEMAGAYSTFARRGVQVEPWVIKKIVGSDGRIIEEHKYEGKRVMAQNDADNLNAILQSVVNSGTGTRARIGRPVAGKTGTAQSYRDAWFVGYTPDLVVSAWVGYPEAQREMRNVHGIRVTGGSIPAQIWRTYVLSVIDSYPSARFAKAPAGGYSAPPRSGTEVKRRTATTRKADVAEATPTTIKKKKKKSTPTTNGAPETTSPPPTSPPPTSPPPTSPPPTSPPPTSPPPTSPPPTSPPPTSPPPTSPPVTSPPTP